MNPIKERQLTHLALTLRLYVPKSLACASASSTKTSLGFKSSSTLIFDMTMYAASMQCQQLTMTTPCNLVEPVDYILHTLTARSNWRVPALIVGVESGVR